MADHNTSWRSNNDSVQTKRARVGIYVPQIEAEKRAQKLRGGHAVNLRRRAN